MRTGSIRFRPVLAVTASTNPVLDRVVEPPTTGVVHVGLALVWIAAQVVALLAGVWGVAVLFAVVGGVAGLQAARSWRALGIGANRMVAGWGPVTVTVLAVFGPTWAGVGLFAVAVTAIVVSAGSRSRGGPLAAAGATVRCALGPGVVGISLVLLFDTGWAAVAMLLILVAGYDLACWVWGGDDVGPYLSRVVGMITVMVLTLAASAVHTVFELDPFGPVAVVWVFGGLAATLCPLGPMVGSLVLPSASAEAPALRRIDVLMVAAPIWLAAMWGYLG